MTAPRNAIFISHATPEDNAFTLWLGGRLTALGYQVFADILRLKGGDDWERILEDAIRNKAKRFLLVATPQGVQKQGVRNEINLAVETAKQTKEEGFIVPLRLAGRIVFTSNGQDLIGDARRLHRMRRTFCKGWRNDKWRDLLLAFWYWLADGANFIDVSLGDDATMRLGLPPLTFLAPFSINSLSDSASSDEEDDDELDVDRDDDGQGYDDEGDV